MPKEKWPDGVEAGNNDDFLIEDEKYIEDSPPKEPPNTGDMASAHFINDQADKTLLIKRVPNKAGALKEQAFAKTDDEFSGLPKKESMGERVIREKLWRGFPDTKHKENKSSPKAIEGRHRREKRTPVGKKPLPLDTDIIVPDFSSENEE